MSGKKSANFLAVFFLSCCCFFVLVSLVQAQCPPMYLDEQRTYVTHTPSESFEDGNGGWASDWIDMFGMYYRDGESPYLVEATKDYLIHITPSNTFKLADGAMDRYWLLYR